jgi:ribosome maturation factor RimP
MNGSETQEIKAGVDLGRVRAAVGPVLSAHGVVLVDLEWLTDRSGWVLRITIEREGSTERRPVDPHPPGSRPQTPWGVTLEDCAEVSRDVSAVLDVEDLVHQRYHLEVSSPGLDRPLRTAAEIARFTGHTAKVKLSRPAPDGQRVLRGLLESAPEGRVAVIVDGKRIEVPYGDVAEANLVFELVAQPKKAQPRKKSGSPHAAGSGERR